MKIVAIDAGRGHCNVSRSVEVAAQAAEQAGAYVQRFNLRDLRIRPCTNCRLCVTGDGCKVHDDLEILSAAISQSNGVIFGIPDSRKRRARECNSMLDRLSSYFGDKGQLKLPGFTETAVPQVPLAQATKRAVIITATRSETPIATFFSTSRGTIRELRSTLAATSISPIGSLEVSDQLQNGRLTADVMSRATSLGRILAGRF